MPATRDGKLWRSQFYYKDWQGVRRKKNKRGFKTKGEADEWERNFLQQQQKNLDISFENFVEIYFADMENRLRESTIINKRCINLHERYLYRWSRFCFDGNTQGKATYFYRKNYHCYGFYYCNYWWNSDAWKH